MTDQQPTYTDFLLQLSLRNLHELDERLAEDASQTHDPYPLALWQQEHSWWRRLARRLVAVVGQL